MDEVKKISLVEGIFMAIFTLTADGFEFITMFTMAIPIIGQIFLVAKWFVAGGCWLIIQFWLIMKGIRGLWFLSGSLLDMVANFFGFDIPFGKTISLFLTINSANHPKLAAVAQIAGADSGAKAAGSSAAANTAPKAAAVPLAGAVAEEIAK